MSAERSAKSKQSRSRWRNWPIWKKALSVLGAVTLAVTIAIVTDAARHLIEPVWQAVNPSPSAPPSNAGGNGSPELVVAAVTVPEVDLSCNQNVNVAGLNASPNPRDLPAAEPGELLAAKDPRTVAVKELSAIGWYRSMVQIGLTTADETPAFIMKVEPVIFKRTAAKPAWGLEFTPPCGGTAQRRDFQAVLDQGSIQDLGVVGVGIGGKGPRGEPLGQAFTVSAADPAVLTVHAYACTGYFEWGLKIGYISAGEQKSASVGTAENPLKLIGGWQDVQRFHGVYDGQHRIAAGPKPSYGQASAAGVPASAREICR